VTAAGLRLTEALLKLISAGSKANIVRSALVAELRRPEPDEGPKHADRLKGTNIETLGINI